VSAAGTAPTTVVIGVGNEFRRDDGVGPAVVRLLRRRDLPGVRLAECDGEAGRLLDLWRDASRVVVVDAVRTAYPRPGRIHRRSLRHPAVIGRPTSSHAADLGSVAELAAALGRLPRLLLFYGVEAADTSFGVGLSAPVAAATQRLADEIADSLSWPPAHGDAGGRPSLADGAAGGRPSPEGAP
jgi:hydrogenase maturation protease